MGRACAADAAVSVSGRAKGLAMTEAPMDLIRKLDEMVDAVLRWKREMN
jgi:hypothetical protein